MQLAAIRVFVDDLAAARAFYEDALGLTLAHDASADGYCRFDTGAVQLIVELAPHVDDAEADAADRALVGRFTGLSFAVTDLLRAHQLMRARDVRFVEPPQRQPWGGWLATFADPAGNEMQLVQFD